MATTTLNKLKKKSRLLIFLDHLCQKFFVQCYSVRFATHNRNENEQIRKGSSRSTCCRFFFSSLLQANASVWLWEWSTECERMRLYECARVYVYVARTYMYVCICVRVCQSVNVSDLVSLRVCVSFVIWTHFFLQKFTLIMLMFGQKSLELHTHTWARAEQIE